MNTSWGVINTKVMILKCDVEDAIKSKGNPKTRTQMTKHKREAHVRLQVVLLRRERHHSCNKGWKHPGKPENCLREALSIIFNP